MASNGNFQEFLGSLLAFESGWDRARYESGQIVDWQLNSWAGGTVQEYFPDYSSWGDLTDGEWEAMAYRSMNSLGFVGYQFGEALLIDLGYYQAETYYGNGAGTNTWQGTWTGKNGATSLEAFMTKDVQDQAILDAFGFNLQVIENGLAQSGESLDDYLGQTVTYYDGGAPVEVTLTMTGILAAAHLRGAWGTLSLLQSGSVTTDEYGTSILKYVDQFGGYDAPSADEIIAGYDPSNGDETGNGEDGDGETGETGDGDDGNGGTTGDPDDGVADGSFGLGSAGVTAQTADVVVNWAWGSDVVVDDFDPESSTIFVSWIGADQLEIAETDAGVLFSIPSNQQTILLEGVALADLSAENFTFLDGTAASEVATAIAAASAGEDPQTGDGDDEGDGEEGDGQEGDGDDGGPNEGPGDDGPGDIGNPDGGSDAYAFTWNWGAREVIDTFDPETDQLDLSGFWTSFDAFEITSDADGNAVIDLTNINNQTITLTGVSPADLSQSNFTGVSGTLAGGTDEGDGPGGNGDETPGGDPVEGEGVSVSLVLVDSWGDKFQFKAVVENTGDAPVDAWSVALDTEMTIVSSWEVSVAEADADTYALSNLSWNGSLDPDETAEFGFIASGDLDLVA